MNTIFTVVVATCATLALAGTFGSVVAQVKWVCPNGYYLASDYKCYPYVQQPPSIPTQSITQACKIDKEAINLDKMLGVNASALAALSNIANDSCSYFGVK
jgi:hypothetical protein